MTNVVKLKRGTGSDPSASDMVVGEPVIRTDTAELFFKKDDGTVAKVSGGGGGPDFKYLALRNSSNNGAASYPAADFTLVTDGTTTAVTPAAAATLLVSYAGVIQQPSTGTSTPANGFALSGSTIKFSANIAAAPDFIIYQESGGIGEPSDNTVSEAKLNVSNSPTNGYFLSAQSGNTGGLTWAAAPANDPSTGIDFNDNVKARWGTGNDLEVYHDGSNSYIKDTGTGRILLNGSGVRINNAANNENMIHAEENGAVELYYDNSLKLETTALGVEIPDGVNFCLGSGADIRMWFQDSGPIAGYIDCNQGHFYIRNNVNDVDGGDIFIQGRSGEESIIAKNDGSVELYYDNSKKLETYTNGVKIPGDLYLDNATNAGKDIHWDESHNYLAFSDDVKASFGDSDLQIWHQSADNRSYIWEGGSGALCIQGSYVKIQSPQTDPTDASEAEKDLAVFKNDGATELYWGGTSPGKKFETTQTGVNVTGNITVTGTVDGVDIAARNTLFGGLTSSSGVLSNGVTATTQSASDNSTKVATTAYTDTAISNLVDSSPSALNTLNELAAALGDDANFSTTVTNSIATKLPLAGGTLTGNTLHGDNIKARFGAGNDLDIFHNSNINYIHSNNAIPLRITTGAETQAVFTTNGSVDLYYDNVRAFKTRENGIQVLGPEGGDAWIRLDADEGDDNDDLWRMLNSGSNYYLQNYAAGSWETNLLAAPNGAIKLYYDNSLKFETTASGANLNHSLNINGPTGGNGNANLNLKPTGSAVYTNLYFYNAAGNSKSEITGYGGGSILFFTSSSFVFSSGGAERWMSNDSYLSPRGTDGSFDLGGSSRRWGDVYIKDSKKIKLGDSDDLEIYHDGTNSIIDNSTGVFVVKGDDLRLKTNSTNEDMIRCYVNGSVELYHNNIKTFSTDGNGIFALGPESGTANVYIYADEGDDDSDKWSITADPSVSILTINNRLSGAFEKSIECNGNGNVELYYDNSKKFETTSTGATISGLLAVSGSTSETSTFTGNGVSVIHASGSNVFIGTQTGTDGKIAVTNNADLHFRTNNTERLRITAAGDINIPVDGDKLQLGASQDLQIYHDGSNSYIKDTGTGDLNISGSIVRLQSSGGETLARGVENGTVELYYNNSKKLETTNIGVELHGFLDLADSNRIRIGNDGDLQLLHDGSDSWIRDTGTGMLRVDGSQIQLRKYGTSEILANFIQDSACELYYDNSKKLETLSSGIRVNDWNLELKAPDNNEARLAIIGDNGDDNNDWSRITSYNGIYKWQNMASGGWETNIECNGNGNVELYYDNSLKLETTSSGITINQAARFVGPAGAKECNWSNSTGVLNFQDDGKATFGTSNDLQIYHDGHSRIKTSSSAAGNLVIDSNNDINLRVNNSEMAVHCKENTSVELYYDNSLKFETFANGIKVYNRIGVNITPTTALQFLDHSGSYEGRASWGNSADLQIYHDGSNSFISHDGAGDLYIDTQGNAEDIYIRSQDGIALLVNNNSHKAIECVSNSAVLLYHVNAKKFETLSNGIKVTNGASGSVYINMSTSSGSSGYLYGGSNQIGILSEDEEWHVKCNKNAAAELYYDNSKKVESTSLGGKVTGGLVVDAGSTNHTGDASLYVSKTTSSDWAGIFDCLSGSEYGLKVNCANGTDYAIAVRDTTNSNHPFRVEGSGVMHSRDHLPFQDNGYDLGTSSYRWRNIYTMDLQLSNEGSDGNSVDGTTGNWTIQEGADDLFIVNNKNGKKFKIALQEVS